MTISSAWSITASVNPPRTVFVNYPLGRTAGRPNEPVEQREIVTAALARLHSATDPGDIVALQYEWSAPWKQRSRRKGDTRTERRDTPQWERPDDATAVGVAK